jgi:hypothetical protein
MRKAFRNFLIEESGALISSEWAIVASVLIMSGTAVALTYSYLSEDDFELILELLTPPSLKP